MALFLDVVTTVGDQALRVRHVVDGTVVLDRRRGAEVRRSAPWIALSKLGTLVREYLPDFCPNLQNGVNCLLVHLSAYRAADGKRAQNR